MPDWSTYLAAIKSVITGFVDSLKANGGVLTFANRFRSSLNSEFSLGSNTGNLSVVRSTSNPATYFSVSSGTGLIYTATNSYTIFSTNSSFATYPITVMADFSPSLLPSVPNENGGILGNISSPGNVGSYAIFTNRVTNKINFIVYNNSSNGGSSVIASNDTMNVGQRYLVFGQVNSSLGISMYINGIRQSETSTSLSLNSANVLTMSEGANSANNLRFYGTIFDSKIWDINLSESEMSGYKTSRNVNLLADFRHIEGQGSTLGDIRSNTGGAILILCGGNDANAVANTIGGVTLQGACDNIRYTIDACNNHDPNIDVYVSNVLPMVPYPTAPLGNTNSAYLQVMSLNLLIDSMMTGRQASKSNLFYVDMNTLFAGTSQGIGNPLIMDDRGTHPNDSGYQIMGNAWAGAITSNRVYVTGKIASVGDSITYGFASTDSFGYRKRIQEVLGVTSYNLVGYFKDPSGDSTYKVTHAGSGGIMTQTMSSLLIQPVLNGFFSINNGTINSSNWTVDRGVIQVTTSSNFPRFTAGYYTNSGFLVSSGIYIESAVTNLFSNGVIDSSSGWATNDLQYNSVGYWRLSLLDSASTVNSIDNLTTYQKSAKISVSHSGTANSSLIFAPISGVSVSTSVVYNISFMAFCNSSKTFNFSSVGGSDLSGAFDIPRYQWIRVSKSFTATSTGTLRPQILLGNQGSYDIYLDQFQIESGNFASSFVPTTTSALTRQLETLTYATSANRNHDIESIFIKFKTFWADTSSVQRNLMGVDSINRTTFFVQAASFTRTSSPDVSSNSNYVLSDNTTQIYGGTFQATGNPNVVVYFNSDSKSASTTDDVSRNYGNNFYLGCDSTTGREINGIIESVAIYSTFKTSSNVNDITTIMGNF